MIVYVLMRRDVSVGRAQRVAWISVTCGGYHSRLVVVTLPRSRRSLKPRDRSRWRELRQLGRCVQPRETAVLGLELLPGVGERDALAHDEPGHPVGAIC